VTIPLQRALEALYGLERRKDRLGLDGTRALLAALGDPQERFRAVHVAGTNGKGSVCALVERVLRVAGVRTGLFTSPHLVDFRERIRVAGRWPDEERLAALLARIEALPEGGTERTFFEVATALGFAWFAAEGVEWAVVEVGLGGRLDSTNVLAPEACAITSIGLDHTEVLGDTLERIAAEKAGIAKPRVPLVSSETTGTAGAVIARVARERGTEAVDAAEAAPVTRAPDGTLRAASSAWGPLELRCGIPGLAPANASCALALLGVLARRGVPLAEAHVREGFAAARWPGRFERCPREPRLWWDGAHNVHGTTRLAAAWREAGLAPAAALVLAVSRDKDVAAMLEPLRAVAPQGTLFATRSASERALDPEAVAAAARAAGWDARALPDVASACAAALERAGRDGTVLLTGSLFAVGEAMVAHGGAPGEWL
jgi:dihydrofolate synthase/folylpolyglutamate synthase